MNASERWTQIDDYLSATLVGSDEALEAALRESERAGLPSIQVTPNQGKLLEVLARSIGARTILEIGTLGGYSTIFLARSLAAGGRVTTLEVDAKHAEVARTNLVRAGVADKVQALVGPASQTLRTLGKDHGVPFDFVFIDADKPSTPEYLDWALRLTRVGGLIVIDNVVRDGGVVDAASADASVIGIRRALEMMGRDPRLVATAIQTVGSKGHDGLAIGVVVQR